jgi:hypothetical protein
MVRVIAAREHADPFGAQRAGDPLDVGEEVKALLAELCGTSHLRAARASAASLLPFAREHFAKEEQMLFPMANNYSARTCSPSWASGTRPG